MARWWAIFALTLVGSFSNRIFAHPCPHPSHERRRGSRERHRRPLEERELEPIDRRRTSRDHTSRRDSREGERRSIKDRLGSDDLRRYESDRPDRRKSYNDIRERDYDEGRERGGKASRSRSLHARVGYRERSPLVGRQIFTTDPRDLEGPRVARDRDSKSRKKIFRDRDYSSSPDNRRKPSDMYSEEDTPIKITLDNHPEQSSSLLERSKSNLETVFEAASQEKPHGENGNGHGPSAAASDNSASERELQHTVSTRSESSEPPKKLSKKAKKAAKKQAKKSKKKSKKMDIQDFDYDPDLEKRKASSDSVSKREKKRRKKEGALAAED